MIRLYGSNETTFTSNGIGVLPDIVSCLVTEELNGMLELELEYPITGKYYDEIRLGRYIYARPYVAGDYEPFEIYKISRPINGIVTVYAQDYSYKTASIPVVPSAPVTFTNQTPAELFESVVALTPTGFNNFSFESNITDRIDYELTEPVSLRSILGDMQELYDGEFRWSRNTIYFNAHRGLDNGVTVRYGKNMTDLKQEESIANTINGIAPYWKGRDGDQDILVTIPEKYAIYQVAETEEEEVALAVIAGEYGNGDERVTNLEQAGYNYERIQSLVNKLCWQQTRLWMTTDNAYLRVVPFDMTEWFDEAPTPAMLSEKAVILVQSLQVGVPEINLTVSFVSLEQAGVYGENAIVKTYNEDNSVLGWMKLGKAKLGTPLYTESTLNFEDLISLTRVSLGDTVSVFFESLGVAGTAKVIKTVYNCITDMYDTIELGDTRATFINTIASVNERIEESETRSEAYFSRALDDATDTIKGVNGGYIVMDTVDGHPYQITILNNADREQATKAIRMNYEGIGFSNEGYYGSFNSAWSIDGTFDANVINVINLNASNIEAGKLTSSNYKSSSGTEGFMLDMIDGRIIAPDLTIEIQNTANSAAQNVLDSDAKLNQMKSAFQFTDTGLVTRATVGGTESPYNTRVGADGFYIEEGTTSLGKFTNGGLETGFVTIGTANKAGELYIPPLAIKPYDTDTDSVYDSWIIVKSS